MDPLVSDDDTPQLTPFVMIDLRNLVTQQNYLYLYKLAKLTIRNLCNDLFGGSTFQVVSVLLDDTLRIYVKTR